MTQHNDYYCGCYGCETTNCRCMRIYTLPRLRDRVDRDLLFFGCGALVCGLIMFSLIWV